MTETISSALVGLISAFIGAAALWLFETRRDKQTKRRDIRVGYLIEAYRRFESVCHRPPLGPDGAKTLESALADIQLFGTSSQVELARRFVSEYSALKRADVDALLADLRRELRTELGLQPSEDKTFFLRVTWSKEQTNQQQREVGTMSEGEGKSDRQTEMDLEVYRQKYEVFRHLDSLRWQIPTFTVGTGSLLLGFAAGKDNAPPSWCYVVIGLMCVFASFAIWRIRKGIDKNHDVLASVAFKLGDTILPREKGGATWWLMVLLLFLGLIGVGAGVVLGIIHWPS